MQPRRNLLTRWLRPAPAPRGVYLWGTVGRGKTWLMDLFFDSLPIAEKQRIHFHRFMARVHEALRERADQRDPLRDIARHWGRRCRVLCFDEFHVSDIADAMLLSGLLDGLIDGGMTLVATSNIPPSELYRDGLQRAHFLPAIELLEQHCDVVHVGGDTDYRLRILERAEIYLHPLDEQAKQALRSRFREFCPGEEMSPELDINGRTFTAVRRGDGVVWFSFEELCEKPRSAADYIEIARAFNTVMVSGVPALDERSNDPARRFLTLVDELYDRNVKLLVSAAVPVEALYSGDRLAFEFQRTRSRLVEMQTHEYLAKPHLP